MLKFEIYTLNICRKFIFSNQRTNELASKWTNGNTDGQTNEQRHGRITNERMNERTSKQTNGRTEGRTNERTEARTNDRSIERTNKQANEQTNRKDDIYYCSLSLESFLSSSWITKITNFINLNWDLITFVYSAPRLKGIISLNILYDDLALHWTLFTSKHELCHWSNFEIIQFKFRLEFNDI